MNTDVQDIVIEDREYLRHGDQPLMVRLLRPAGEGPFPFVIDLHGGAWNNSDRFSCQMRDEILVEAGIAAAAVDFRHGPDQYPSSLADINYAIRWLKLHADELRLDPARIGITGASSGGHLAMLTAMRPTDPRYIEIVGETAGKSVDASLKCVALVAPVINPLSRYRNAQRLLAEPNPPEWATGIPDRHDTYWGTAEAMAEGSPQLILERGERATLLPAVYIQGMPDVRHVYRDPEGNQTADEPERFVHNYKAAGGDIELIIVDTDAMQSPLLYAPLAAFMTKQL